MLEGSWRCQKFLIERKIREPCCEQNWKINEKAIFISIIFINYQDFSNIFHLSRKTFDRYLHTFSLNIWTLFKTLSATNDLSFDTQYLAFLSMNAVGLKCYYLSKLSRYQIFKVSLSYQIFTSCTESILAGRPGLCKSPSTWCNIGMKNELTVSLSWSEWSWSWIKHSSCRKI